MDEEYTLPQVITVALQTARGGLLKTFGPPSAEAVLKSLDEKTLIEIFRLIGDLIDDRYTLKQQVGAHEELIKEYEERISKVAVEIAALKQLVTEISEDEDPDR